VLLCSLSLKPWEALLLLERAVVLIGLLGGFTTFSAFGLQTFTLLRDGQMGVALLNNAVSNVNIALSNAGGLLMVWVGYSLAKIV